MQFPVESVQQSTVLSEAFFNKREVNIEEDWLLPSDVSNELKLPEGYSIKKGTYMIENRNDTYNIILIP